LNHRWLLPKFNKKGGTIRRHALENLFSLIRRSLALARSDSLYRNSTFLAANAATNALLGFSFWAIAARLLSAQAVGLAAAVITVATLVATFSYLGFDNALIKYLPTSSAKDHDTHTGLTLAGAAAIIGASIALTIAADSGSKLRILVSSPFSIAAFGALCLLTSWNSLTNVVFIADRTAQYVLLTTVVFCVARLPFLFLFNHGGYSDATSGWLIGQGVSVFASFFILYKVSGYRYRPSFDIPAARRMVHFAAANYVSSLAAALPPLVFPSVILSVIGPKYAAYFYVVYLIILCLFQLPFAVSQSLFAEGSRDRDNMWTHVRRATMVTVVITVPSIVVLIAVGYPLLELFGHAYATHGYGCLFVLCLSAVPTMVNLIGGAILRIAGRIRTLMVGSILGAAFTTGAGILALIEFRSLIAVAGAMLVGQVVVSSVYVVDVARLYRAERRER
jgi:O-antigen/teichoic acid export membrane protein